MFYITQFPKLTDSQNMTIHHLNWDRLAATLTHPRAYVPKEKRQLWSPATFEKRRSIQDAKYVYLLVFDLDGGSRLQETEEALQKHNLQYILHTTASHTEEVHKYRVVLPIFTPVPGYLWKHYYSQAVNWWDAHIGSPVDPSCKDVSRAYYISYGGEGYYSSIQPGDWLDFTEEAQLDYNQAEAMKNEEQVKRELEIKKRLNFYNNRQKQHVSQTNWYKYIYEKLKTDEEERRLLGSRIGGIEHDGKIEGFICPICNRKDATFFYINPILYTNAYCLHKNSCGNKGTITSFSIWALAKHNNLI